MWCNRDPSLRRSGVGNIFIKNLDGSIDNKALYDTFSAFGSILSCKIVLDENDVSKGYGYVQFETQEAAEQAIEKVNGMLLNDKQVYVAKWQSQEERMELLGDQPRKYTNVYVKNFAEDVREAELTNLFSPFGNILSIRVMAHKDGRSKCFGFVSFDDPDSAAKAVEELNDKEFHGRVLFCGRIQKKAERNAELRRRFQQQKMERINQFQGVHLYIKNLEETIDDHRLRKEFENYGTITSAKIMRDDKGNSKGFGFVCFQSPEEATKAVTEKNGQIVLTKPLYVALAPCKEERQAQLAAQHMQRVAGRIIPQGQEVLNPSTLAQASVSDQKQMLGERLFPLISQTNSDLAGKITGMLLEIDNSELLHMLEFRDALAAKVEEAVSVLHAHQAREATQEKNKQGQRPMYPPQAVVRTRFQGPGVRGQPGYPPMMGRARPRMPNRPMSGHNQKQARGAAGGMSVPMQRVGPTQGPPARANKYKPPVNQAGPGSQTPASNASATQGIAIPGQEVLNPSTLAQASVSDQKQMLGERLFPLISQTHSDLAGKITGMLLEIDNSELLHMLEFRDALAAKVEEAVSVLHAHQAREATQEKNKQGQRPMYPPQAVVRTRFQGPGVRGQPGYPPMMGRARPRMPNRPMGGHNQQQARGAAGGMSVPMQRVGPTQGPPARANKYKPPVNQAGPGSQTPASNANATQGIAIPGQEVFYPSTLAQASVSDQKQMLGERLFPLISQTHADLAGKITGMLLEIDNSDLLHMLEFRDALAAKVEEAVSVLHAHQAREATQEKKNTVLKTGQRPMYPPQAVVRTRFQGPGVRGQPGYPPMMGRARPRMPNRPMGGHNQQQARGAAGGMSVPMQRVGPTQGPPARANKYKPPANQAGPGSQTPASNANATQGIAIPGQEVLNPSTLAQASVSDQKQMLGERLFPLISQTHADLAGKITGMLLEMDNSELLHMLEFRDALAAKVEEAVSVLHAHHANS